jgi:hypothetical protein
LVNAPVCKQNKNLPTVMYFKLFKITDFEEVDHQVARSAKQIQPNKLPTFEHFAKYYFHHRFASIGHQLKT